jgi:uncharacterized protein (TIGR00251 family)
MARITLYCQPGAKQTQLAGLHDGKPKLQLKAPPVDGEANKALIAYLAKLCGVAKSAISIEMGAASRIKRVEVAGVSDEQLRAALGLNEA